MAKTIRTMEEFSEFVGLSRPTVSKYFNDPMSVRPKTRSAIEQALSVSGFRPNLLAVNLNRKHSKILGVIVASSVDPFFMALTREIESKAWQAGYFTFILSSDGNPEIEARAIETFRSMNVAGVIIAPLGSTSLQRKLTQLSKSIPIISVDCPLEDNIPFVGTDNFQSASLMVDYLCRSGDVPCFFEMPQVNNNASQRREAYERHLEGLGHEPMVLRVEPSASWDFEAFGFQQTQKLLKDRGGFPSKTVFCANDRIAFGVLAAVYAAGYRVGRGEDSDIRIAGHDDHPLSQYTCPSLTTISQNYTEIGSRAVELLLRKIGDMSSSGAGELIEDQIRLDAVLQLRESA